MNYKYNDQPHLPSTIVQCFISLFIFLCNEYPLLCCQIVLDSGRSVRKTTIVVLKSQALPDSEVPSLVNNKYWQLCPNSQPIVHQTIQFSSKLANCPPKQPIVLQNSQLSTKKANSHKTLQLSTKLANSLSNEVATKIANCPLTNPAVYQTLWSSF